MILCCICDSKIQTLCFRPFDERLCDFIHIAVERDPVIEVLWRSELRFPRSHRHCCEYPVVLLALTLAPLLQKQHRCLCERKGLEGVRVQSHDRQNPCTLVNEVADVLK